VRPRAGGRGSERERGGGAKAGGHRPCPQPAARPRRGSAAPLAQAGLQGLCALCAARTGQRLSGKEMVDEVVDAGV
jgi:hypothetical protein